MSATTSGREPIQIVEIDVDQCSLTYGVAPCTAALGATGDRKCYNTRATCQDVENYTLGTPLTLYFTRPRVNLPKDLGVTLIPSLRSVSSRPARIEIGEGLGSRASITVEWQDHPHHDRGIDPYPETRTFDPFARGTYWGKFLARNKFYEGRPIRVREGYIGDSLAAMRVRRYVIDRIDGPGANGRVRLTAKDILKLTEGDRAQAPAASTGELLAAITDAATSATLSPAGIGNSEYPASGTARIGSEVMTFTRSGDALTLTRAQFNTEATAHDEGDTVQLCLRYTDTPAQDVLEDLIVNYAPVDAAFVPKADWDAEADEWLGGFAMTGLVTKPEPVKDLVSEILKQTLAYIWWDEYDQEIKFRAIRPATTVPAIYNDDSHIVADSARIERKAGDRASQVWVYYDQIDPTEGKDETDNYRRLRIFIDSDAESAEEYDQRRIRKIFARFLDATNDGAAAALGGRTVTRLRDTPEILSFALDGKDRAVALGDLADITTRLVVDDTGAAKEVRYQIIERDESQAGHLVECKAQIFFFAGRYGFIAPNGTVDYSSATDAQQSAYCWIAPDSGSFANGDDAYKVV